MSEKLLMFLLLIGGMLGFIIIPEIGITLFMLLAMWWVLVKIFSRGED